MKKIIKRNEKLGILDLPVLCFLLWLLELSSLAFGRCLELCAFVRDRPRDDLSHVDRSPSSSASRRFEIA